MQQITVDVIGVEVIERTGERLLHLSGKLGAGIVGKAVVLSALVGKFSLQEKVIPGSESRTIGSGEAFAHGGFEVVFSLVGSIDSAKAGA